MEIVLTGSIVLMGRSQIYHDRYDLFILSPWWPYSTCCEPSHICYELTNALAKSFPTARCPLYTRDRKWPKDIQVHDNDRWCWCLGVSN
jgi:hypothetical protein